MGACCSRSGSSITAEPKFKAKKQNTYILQSDMVRKVTNHDVKDDYKLLAVLGEGGFGEVKRAFHKITNIERAIKIVRKSNLSKDGGKKLMDEVALVREIDHPNALKIVEYYDDPYCFYIVNEAYTGGTLYDKWINGFKFTETKIGEIIRDVLRPINYMHHKGIVHRDIKPQNIMFATADNNTIIKLIDFGEASPFTHTKKLDKIRGTVTYMAPEVLEGNYNEKCDIWSLGVVLYMLLSGKLPFDAHSEEILKKKILRAEVSTNGKAFEKVSEDAKDLIQNMLKGDPAKRYSAQQCLDHPWITNVLKNMQIEKTIDLKVMERIANFKGMSALKNAFWASVISYFSSYDETVKIVKTWTTLDKKGLGVLSKEDLKSGFEAADMAMKPAELDLIFTALTFNKSGTILYTEFLNAAFEKESFLTDEKIESMFKIFDQDADGFLSQEELKDFVTPNSKVAKIADYNNMIIHINDTYKDKVSLEDFKKVIQTFLC